MVEMKMFKMLILDSDGVLSSQKIVDVNGNSVYKQFEDKNWTAIKKFKACGIPVVVISGDLWNERIMSNRNIPFYCSKKTDGILDKSQFLPLLETQYDLNVEELAFVGDDFFDLDIMKLVGYSFCPSDANCDVIEHCNNLYNQKYPLSIYKWPRTEGNPFILKSKGGEKVIDDLFSICETVFGLEVPENFDQLVRKIDSKEK